MRVFKVKKKEKKKLPHEGRGESKGGAAHYVKGGGVEEDETVPMEEVIS